MEKISNRNKIVTSLVSGSIAGALAKTVIAPLDRTKINFQVSNSSFNFKNAVKFIIKSYRKDGFFSLWRGNSATMARIIPFAAIQFCSHEQWKILLRVEETSVRFCAGSLAGITAQTCTYPLDVARACMAVTTKQQHSSLLKNNHTLPSIYKGYVPTILGVIPYAGISFTVYEVALSTYENYFVKSSNPLEKMFCGALGGLMGQSVSYPLDIVRRRMQTSIVTNNKRLYYSILSTAHYVYHHEGFFGFYKGLSLNWIKGPVAVGISFSTNDTVKRLLRKLKIFQ